MLLRSLNDLSLTQLYPILAARLESIYGQLKTRRGGRAAKPICFLVIILNMSILQIFSVVTSCVIENPVYTADTDRRDESRQFRAV